jgi:XisI protein
VIIDQEGDHYLLVNLGWNHDETKREYHVVMHLDIVDGKIWLQQNATEVLVDQVLLERGIPPEDIVLGLLPTFSRQHSGYGVGQSHVFTGVTRPVEQCGLPTRDRHNRQLP